MTTPGGKGSTQRPTDQEAFGRNFDAIDWGRRVAELVDTFKDADPNIPPLQMKQKEMKDGHNHA